MKKFLLYFFNCFGIFVMAISICCLLLQSPYFEKLVEGLGIFIHLINVYYYLGIPITLLLMIINIFVNDDIMPCSTAKIFNILNIIVFLLFYIILSRVMRTV